MCVSFSVLGVSAELLQSPFLLFGFQNKSPWLDVWVLGGRWCKLGVKPDFKVVSARLDAREETGSEAQRVSHPVCECSLTGSWLASRHWDGWWCERVGYSLLPPFVLPSAASRSLWGRSLADRKFCPSLQSVRPFLVFLAHVKSRLCRHRRQWRWRRLRGRGQQWSVRGGVAGRGRGPCKLGLCHRRQQWWRRRRRRWWLMGAGLSQRPAAESFSTGAALEQLQAVVPLPAVSRANLSLPQHRLADASPEVTGAAQTVRTVWGAKAGISDLTWDTRPEGSVDSRRTQTLWPHLMYRAFKTQRDASSLPEAAFTSILPLFLQPFFLDRRLMSPSESGILWDRKLSWSGTQTSEETNQRHRSAIKLYNWLIMFQVYS